MVCRGTSIALMMSVYMAASPAALAADINAEADYRQGLQLLEGTNRAEPDEAQALLLFERAAARHHPGAELELGFLAKDSTRAVFWFREAAGHGNAEAQYNLGVAYALGDGVERSSATAANLFEQAAIQGFPEAVYNLGIMHLNGDDVPRDVAFGCGLLTAAQDLGVEMEPGPTQECEQQPPDTRKEAERIAANRSLWRRDRRR